MDALSLLRRDHRELKKILAELEPTTDRAVRTRTRLFRELQEQLVAHETIEEDLFYPALRAHPDGAAAVRAHEAHGGVDELLDPLRQIPVSDPTWGAEARRLKDRLEDRFVEEESQLFELARRILDSAELQALGLRMAERKAAVSNEVAGTRTGPHV